MAPDVFYTPRLTGRRFSTSGTAWETELLTDPVTMKTLAIDGRVPCAETISVICERHLRHWDIHGFGLWQMFGTATGEFVGNCGLRTDGRHGSEEMELFFALRAPFFRLGYGTEMVQKVIEIGVHEIGATHIVGFTSSDNLGSQRLMEKVGMRYDGDAVHAGVPHRLYRISRPAGG